ncbi:MAG: ACP S-malonyltransferase [Acidobacteriota bacterium]
MEQTMVTAILLDNDLKGHGLFIEVGWRETGWAGLLPLDFKLLRDFGLPDDLPDQEIWRFVQRERLLLVTNNRNREDATSLQATIERENTPTSLPVLTISTKERLVTPVYRQRVAHSLAAILLYPEEKLGAGRVFLP